MNTFIAEFTGWFSPNNVKDYLVPWAQILSPFLAAILVLYQINSNYRNNLRAQSEKLKDDLKSKLHAEIDAKIQVLSDAVVEASNIFHSLDSTFRAIRAGSPFQQFSLTTPEVIGLKAKVAYAAADLVTVIEKYEIVIPEMKIFQTGLNVFSYDLHMADGGLFTDLMKILPYDVNIDAGGHAATTRIQQAAPSEDTISHIEKLAAPYKRALDDLGGLVYDLRVDIQNALLSHLFNRRIPVRQPIDPSIIVITTEPAKVIELNAVFARSAWGIDTADVTASVQAAFSDQLKPVTVPPTNRFQLIRHKVKLWFASRKAG